MPPHPVFLFGKTDSKVSFEGSSHKRGDRYFIGGSDARTIIEVETEDRIGLLYAIAQVFAQLELNITVAKILTERGAAVDTFYVTDMLGKKIEDAPVLKLTERRLHEAIAALDGAQDKAG